MNTDKVSVTLTHYKRIDLLDQTIESFLHTNSYPIDEFLIIDDSAEDYYGSYIAEKYKDVATIIINDRNIGQRKSLDILFSKCKNNYIFHLEEDWLFDTDSVDYIDNSLTILKAYPNIHQVHIRHQSDYNHSTVGDTQIINNIKFKYLDSNWNGMWNGFSFNPGLRRGRDIQLMFPDGLCSFPDECQLAMHSRNFNYRAVTLFNTVCKHTGCNNRTQINGRGL